MSVPVSEWPVPAGAASVLIYGGSFDPPHRGHLELAPAARDALALSWMVYVPAARSPFKETGPEASGAARVEMLRVGLGEDAQRVGISTFELNAAREGEPSYTVRSVERFARDAPCATLRLLIGADQARSFHRWREAERILALAEPAVMLRGEADDAATLLSDLGEHWPAREVERWRERLVRLPRVDASSTALRDAIARGAWDEAERMTPRSVLDVWRSGRST